MKRFLLLITTFLTFIGNTYVLADDIPTGLIRLKNRRTSTAYLTSTTAGSATGAAKKSGDYSQVWVCLTSGSGYTVRSAQTGEYLQANFGSPAAAATTLYIQVSPNATGYYNISSSSAFSGQTCMNLGNNGTSITKWSYSNDAGSDWAIEAVTDVSIDDVKERMLSMTGYAGELSEGKYYRVISSYGRALIDTPEVGGDMSTLPVDASDISQYWTLIKDGTGWRFKNVLTERIIARQTTTSAPFHTSTEANVNQFGLNVAFQVTRTADEWSYKWTIAFPGDQRGFHDASGQSHNMVLWNTSADASVWQFEECEVSQEAIDAARGKLNEYEEIVAQFEEIVKKKSTLQTALNALFDDKACTTLKEEIAALTDEQLAENASFATLTDDMKAMVLKIKNNTWQQFTDGDYTADYERFFRIADYKVYSHYQDMMNSSNFTMSNSFGKLSGPTGIVANKGDVIYIYVDANASSRCTLQLEAVSTDGVPGGNTTGVTTNLKQGLNLFQFAEQKMLYIFYQLNTTSGLYAQLKRYPDIKIHIEGGQLNGYWDATRGMTNADWKLLQKDLLKASPVLNLKTEHLVFCMNADKVKECEPNEMEGLMRIWDKIPANEERYMGIEDFEGRFRNIWNVFSIQSNYMYATTYGTYYNETTLPTVMNYATMCEPGNLWGPSHEIGHNHQASINVIGTTESSNNMFSNINTFEQGIWQTRRQLPPDVFSDLAKGTPWLGRDIWNTTSMFFQLYLYFHGMHHDDEFLPNLFRTMRKNPINKGTYNSSVTYTYTEDGVQKTGQGANVATGAKDYLHLAKMICDVAKADLSEFFEAYGMFVPVSNYHVGDYSNYVVTTTQAEIDAAKKYMQKYSKKLGNIMFIDDHIVRHPANPDNIFEGKPAADGLVKENFMQSAYNASTAGDVGDYEEFDGHEGYDVDGDYFKISGSSITFQGTGYVGHKFYDLDGNLIWATNAKKATLPTKLRTLGPDKYYVVAAQQNMEDVPCAYYHITKSKTYKSNVYFGQEDGSKEWIANESTDLTKYLPENAIAVLVSESAPESLKAETNVIAADGTATSIAINGDKPFYLPSDVTAASVAFQKAGTGYAALALPFDVTSDEVSSLQTASLTNDAVSIQDATAVAAGKPVVFNGKVDIKATEKLIKGGSYQAQSDIKILSSDGQSIEVAETASPFIFSFNNGDGISVIAADGKASSDAAEVFDLTGRRVQHLTKGGVYIIGGKKVIVK